MPCHSKGFISKEALYIASEDGTLCVSSKFYPLEEGGEDYFLIYRDSGGDFFTNDDIDVSDLPTHKGGEYRIPLVLHWQ